MASGAFLATRLIAAVRRSRLRRAGSAADQGHDITRAIDVLMGGV
jgi:toxin CcdB